MTALYCLRCSAAWGRCGHSAGFYEDPRYARLCELEPVETTTGEVLRQAALGVLSRRYTALLGRSKDFQFSELEIQHMNALEIELDKLQRMAPVAALEEPRADLDLEALPLLT